MGGRRLTALMPMAVLAMLLAGCAGTPPQASLGAVEAIASLPADTPQRGLTILAALQEASSGRIVSQQTLVEPERCATPAGDGVLIRFQGLPTLDGAGRPVAYRLRLDASTPTSAGSCLSEPTAAGPGNRTLQLGVVMRGAGRVDLIDSPAPAAVIR